MPQESALCDFHWFSLVPIHIHLVGFWQNQQPGYFPLRGCGKCASFGLGKWRECEWVKTCESKFRFMDFLAVLRWLPPCSFLRLFVFFLVCFFLRVCLCSISCFLQSHIRRCVFVLVCSMSTIYQPQCHLACVCLVFQHLPPKKPCQFVCECAFFQASALLCTEDAKFWPFLANFG